MVTYIELVPDRWTAFESNDPVLDEICRRTGLRTVYYKDTCVSNIERITVVFQTPDGSFVFPFRKRPRVKTTDELMTCENELEKSVTLDNAVEKLRMSLERGMYLINCTTTDLCIEVPQFSCLDELKMKLDIAN